jgi:CBS domain-containing protein
MAHIRDILKSKKAGVISITPDTIVYHALERMVESNISALPVTEGEKLVGIFTEKDYARKVILKGKSSKKSAIREIMTPNPFTVSQDTTIDECMRLMTDRRIRHLPVMEKERLIGIISIGDVVKFIIDEQKYIIENLEHYITGTQ